MQSITNEEMRVLLSECTAAVFVNVEADPPTIIGATRPAEELFGYLRRELVGQALDILIPADLRERHRGNIRTFLANPTPRHMGRGILLDGLTRRGERIPLEIGLDAQRLGDPGCIVAVATIIRREARA